MKKILVIRHGQTNWNLENRIQGRTDTNLNPKGIEQAYGVSQNLKDKKIDLIISSPLKRTRQTAEIINRNRNIPMMIDNRLIEISYGELEGKLTNEIKKRGDFGNTIDGKTYKKAETSEDFIKRVFNFLEDLKEFKEDNILLVTHNEVCKAIAIYFNSLPLDNNMNNLGMENCEVVTYEI